MKMKPVFFNLLIGMILFTGSGCTEMHPEPLVFFEVKTVKIEPEGVLGNLKVFGEVNDQEKLSITEYGVISANRLKNLELNIDTTLVKSSTPLSGSTFSFTIRNLNLDSTYYVRAYAKVENGRIAYGDILTFTYGVNLTIAKHQQLNDTLYFDARLTGLKRFLPLVPQIQELGIELETTSPSGAKQLVIEKRRTDSPVGDGDYAFKVDSILFNQAYKAHFYVISGSKRWNSPTYSITTVGGWKKLRDLNQPLQGSISVEIDNRAYIGFGYPKDCEVDNRTKFREYEPQSGGFRDIVSNDFVYGRKHASLFRINNRIFYGLGQNQGENCNRGYRCDFFEFIPSTGQSKLVSDCFPGGPRSNAVAFSLEGRGYVGLGHGRSEPYYLNDFWEFDPSSNLGNDSWRKLEGLDGNALKNREAAFVFQFPDRVFVGGGAAGDLYFNDCWEFSPPGPQGNKILWIPASDFPGQPRQDAFSLTLNGKGYMGLGYHSLLGSLNDFWEFNPQKPLQEQWQRLPDFPSQKRENAVVFTLNGLIYVGGGQGRQTFENQIRTTYPLDFWVYTPTK